MITTNSGYKKLEASDYVSAALSDENSAFNYNVDKTEQELAGKLPKSGGSLSGKTTLENGASIAFRNAAGSDMNAISLAANGDIAIGAAAATGDMKLYAGSEKAAYLSQGSKNYRIWTAKNLIVSAEEPASPSEGDIWIDIS